MASLESPSVEQASRLKQDLHGIFSVRVLIRMIFCPVEGQLHADLLPLLQRVEGLAGPSEDDAALAAVLTACSHEIHMAARLRQLRQNAGYTQFLEDLLEFQGLLGAEQLLAGKTVDVGGGTDKVEDRFSYGKRLEGGGVPFRKAGKNGHSGFLRISPWKGQGYRFLHVEKIKQRGCCLPMAAGI